MKLLIDTFMHELFDYRKKHNKEWPKVCRMHPTTFNLFTNDPKVGREIIITEHGIFFRNVELKRDIDKKIGKFKFAVV